ncbi:secreted RxLR effector protein 161-like [Primulina huaijiensis]|uniref:secreted RxLR effector protein 161-like n=1 Tax=Primulina huaijiensis TaxID=1492673 RepID=UPI003CC6ED62
MSHGVNLSKSMCPKTDEEMETMSRITYVSAIGSILYGMISTRPDIAYALSVARRYQSNPGPLPWKVVKDILKYLRRTKNLFLVYGSGELKLEGYTDSSFQSEVDDSKSTSGFVFNLNGGAVSWKSSKQDTTADSTTEAEYIATSAAAKEGVWMRNFIQELGVIPQTVDPVPVYCDNTGAVAQAKELRTLQRSKHILRKFHIIREIVGRGDISVERVASADNVADPLTKPLPGPLFEKHRKAMCLRSMDSWL